MGIIWRSLDLRFCEAVQALHGGALGLWLRLQNRDRIIGSTSCAFVADRMGHQTNDQALVSAAHSILGHLLLGQGWGSRACL